MLQNATNQNFLTIYSQNAPATTRNPAWWELDTNNRSKHGWPWFWSGTRWVSPRMERELVLEYFGITAGTGFYIHPGKSFNSGLGFLVQGMATTLYHSVTQNVTNNWIITFGTKDAANNGTSSSTIYNSAGKTANTWATDIISTDIEIDPANASSLVVVTPSGAPGSLFGSINVLYRLFRP